MKTAYSIVFYPREIIDLIRQIKMNLKNQIGWYDSVNSEAHITINEFQADEMQFLEVQRYLRKIVYRLDPCEIFFESIGDYSNGALFLQPDNTSVIYMKEIMDELHKGFPLPKMIKFSEPHLIIARRLNPEKLARVKNILGQGLLNYRFLCNAITIRKFDEDRKQFDILESMTIRY